MGDVMVREWYLARVRCRRYSNRGEGMCCNYILGAVRVKAWMIIGYGILGHLDGDENGRWGRFIGPKPRKVIDKGRGV